MAKILKKALRRKLSQLQPDSVVNPPLQGGTAYKLKDYTFTFSADQQSLLVIPSDISGSTGTVSCDHYDVQGITLAFIREENVPSEDSDQLVINATLDGSGYDFISDEYVKLKGELAVLFLDTVHRSGGAPDAYARVFKATGWGVVDIMDTDPIAAVFHSVDFDELYETETGAIVSVVLLQIEFKEITSVEIEFDGNPGDTWNMPDGISPYVANLKIYCKYVTGD